METTINNQQEQEYDSFVFLPKEDYDFLTNEIATMLKPYIYFKENDKPIIKTLFDKLHLRMIQKCKEYADNITKIDVKIENTIEFSFMTKNDEKAKFKVIK